MPTIGDGIRKQYYRYYDSYDVKELRRLKAEMESLLVLSPTLLNQMKLETINNAIERKTTERDAKEV